MSSYGSPQQAGGNMETAPLIVVAVFRARSDTAAALLAMLESMLSPTRAESGCHRYDLYRSIDDPSVFFFYEVWAGESDHRRHLETPHVRHLLEAAPGLLDGAVSEYRGSLVDR
jgi:quinol monooxygenase YgiN